MPEVAHYGHENVGKHVCFCGVAAKLVVLFVKLFAAYILMTEHLYYLLPVHHLFNVAVYIAQGFLLLHEEFAALAAYYLGYPHGARRHKQHDKGHPYVGDAHGYKHRYYRYRRGEQLRHGLRYKLAQRVGIVGVAAHHVAVGVGVKIFYRQGLHVLKHAVAHLFLYALSHRYHKPVVAEGAKQTYQVYARHAYYGKHHVCIVRRNAVFHPVKQRVDVGVYHGFDKGGADNAGYRAYDYPQRHQYQMKLVFLHIGKQAHYCFSVGLFALCAHARVRAGPSSAVHHFSSPPLFCEV